MAPVYSIYNGYTAILFWHLTAVQGGMVRNLVDKIRIAALKAHRAYLCRLLGYSQR